MEKRSLGIRLSLEQHATLTQASSFLKQTSDKLGMVSSSAAAVDVYHAMGGIQLQNDGLFDLSLEAMRQLSSALGYQIRSFRDELEARCVFVMNPAHTAYYTPTAPLFGGAVDEAFPSAALEIDEAGKCRAVGRWTACVMHLMRALEAPISALALKFSVDIGQNWNSALNQIDAALKSIAKSTDGAEAEQWASEASAHLRVIKNAWRNHAQHGKARYDEEQAISIWNNVESLMRNVSRKLAE